MAEQHVQFLMSKRLYLRPVEIEDLDRYYRWMNDRAVTRTLLRHTPLPRGAEEAWIRACTMERPSTDFVFAVVLAETREHIGTVGLHEINWIDRTGTTGWFIGEKEHWGKGYATEAVLLMLHYAFTGLNLRKITSQTIASNIASNRVHEKCGYRECGRSHAQVFRDGQYVDELLFELFAEEFAAVWERHAPRALQTPA
ncbi:MAG: GNAT family N-acetyltransferase [bacterium]|nr:GNAT family N-acetyltransferase [bacterium]